MLELDRLTVAEYTLLDDKEEYDFAIKYARIFTEPVDEYGIGDMMELPFGVIKDFQYELESGFDFTKLLAFAAKITKLKDITAEPMDKFMRFANYLTESMRQIIEVENKTLSHEPSESEQSAGMERFENLGVYLQIRSLTGGDVTKFEAVRSLPYSLCFTELFAAKQLADYEKDLIRLNKNSTFA
jgi:hypothetical protein